MKQTIRGEQPFQVLATNFSIGPSSEGYTLQISADGNNYSDLFAVGANTTRMVTGVANGSYYRLSGNNSEVTVNWQTQCSDGGSGAIVPATETTLGGIKVGDGLSITADGTLSANGGSASGGTADYANSADTANYAETSDNTNLLLAQSEEPQANDLDLVTFNQNVTEWSEGEPAPENNGRFAKRSAMRDGVNTDGSGVFYLQIDVEQGVADGLLTPYVGGKGMDDSLLLAELCDKKISATWDDYTQYGGDGYAMNLFIEGVTDYYEMWGSQLAYTAPNELAISINGCDYKFHYQYEDGYHKFWATYWDGEEDVIAQDVITTHTLGRFGPHIYNEEEGTWEKVATEQDVEEAKYTLPAATNNTLGGVKVGSGLNIENDGTLNAEGVGYDEVQSLIDDNNYRIEDGEIVAGMAKQLYSPDGVTSEGEYAYRTTAGDEDVSTGPAKLKKMLGNATYPEVQYSDSVVLMREGSEVEGFEADIEWGENMGWVNYVSTADNVSNLVQKMKFVRSSNSGRLYVTVRYNSTDSASFGFNFNQTGLTTYDKTTAITTTQLAFDVYNIVGDVTYDGTNIIIEITGGTTGVECLRGISSDNGAEGSSYSWEGTDIPNDIPIGESTYTYSAADTAWTPSLPQAITAMTLNSETYVPQDGDELVVLRNIYAEEGASYPMPSSFVALGLNSFNRDGSVINYAVMEGYDFTVNDYSTDDYTLNENMDSKIWGVKAVTGLENGYVVYHPDDTDFWVGVYSPDNDVMSFSATVHTDTYDVVYPTDEFHIIVFNVSEYSDNKICVHPRWSGYRDEDYEDYEESYVDLYPFFDYPLVSIGNVRNEWDFENKKAIVRIGIEDFSDEEVQYLIGEGKELGVDFAIDDAYIYYVLDEESYEEYDVEVDGDYTANDFSVEYFEQDGEISYLPVIATTWYMNNLVDKLRRIQALEHLDNLNGTGSEDTVYECDDRLWYWKSTSGAVAEWTDRPDAIGDGKGFGLIFSHIPNLQTLFETKYVYDGDSEYKAFRMSGDTLVMTNTSGTVLSACTVGEAKQISVRNNSSTYWVKVKVEKHWIGFEFAVSMSIRNVWDGKVSGGHFGIVDHSNYPYLSVTTDSGIARWNSKGQVVHKESGSQTSTIKFNNASKYYIATGSYGFDFYAPTVGGTSGQILQSNGNAAPTWINWIKVVKITSDAYENLPTPRDPNTLYVIDDESNA